ncbi:MAG TPA: ABC transporter family substrate-binding protein [Pseudonocardiaceae bacterium]
MRRSRLVPVLALLATGALVLSACGGGGAEVGTERQQDQRPDELGQADEVFKRPKMDDTGEFTMVRESGFTDYNNGTGAANAFQNTVILSNVQPSPYFFDLVDGQIVIKVDGDVMESVEVTSTDPMQVVWKIRKEAVWSDGPALSCKDFHLQWIAATSQVMKTGDDGGQVRVWDTSPTGYDQIEKLTCSDEGKTVTTDFSKPYADYRSLFNFMVPAHILEKQTGIADITAVTDSDAETMTKAAEFFNTGWVGFTKELAPSAGPYLIESSNEDETVLVRNDKWWAERGGPAKVRMRVNTDSQSASQQLQNREVDIIAVQADGAVAQQLRGDSSITTFAAAGQTYEHIDFRMDLPLFQDKAVRDAVAACVNRQDLVDKLVKDIDPSAKPLGNVMFMPNEVGYEDHYSDTGNGDAEAAAKILTDAGYTKGADGIFAKNGQRVSFKLGHRIVERRSQTVRLIQSHCAPAGVEVIDDQSENFNDVRLKVGDFDMALFAWVGTAVKSSAYGNYVSADAGGSSNYNRYSNKELDRLYTEANSELDYDKRVQMLNEVDKLMRADMHSLPLFVLSDFAAADADISPISYVGAYGGVTWNMFAWKRG